jgi:hypothetical protein
MQNCKQEEEEEEEEEEEFDDDDVPCTVINYMRTFCAPLHAFLPSFILARIPSASNFEQSSPLLFIKDVFGALRRYPVTPRSKNTQDPCYYVRNIITHFVHQLLPAQEDCSILFSSKQNCGDRTHTGCFTTLGHNCRR